MGHQKGNTPSGLVVPSWLPSLPSRLCGSPNRNTTKQVHPSSTENVSNFSTFCTGIVGFDEKLLIYLITTKLIIKFKKISIKINKIQKPNQKKKKKKKKK